MEKSPHNSPNFKTWFFCSKLSKPSKTHENSSKPYKIWARSWKSTREGVGLTSGWRWKQNIILPPTWRPFIGGWPDHLRRPNVNPKPCKVRRPKLTFGGRTCPFLPWLFSFKNSFSFNLKPLKQVKIHKKTYVLPFSRVPTPEIPPDYRNSDAGLEPGITFSPP